MIELFQETNTPVIYIYIKHFEALLLLVVSKVTSTYTFKFVSGLYDAVAIKGSHCTVNVSKSFEAENNGSKRFRGTR